MMRTLYDTLLHLALPALPLRLWWRGRKEPGYRQDVGQRFGRYATRERADERATQPLIWLHAVSLGETRAARPLLRALHERWPDHRLLITQMTATGRAAASELCAEYGEYAKVAWLPYDYPWAVRRFLARFQPTLAIIMETELWPNLLAACARTQVPTFVVNARLSARSARGYARLGAFAHTMFADVTAFAAQSKADATRLQALGARAVTVTGNLKFDVMPEADVALRAAQLRKLYGTRKVFLAASTREGEEALLLDALARAPLGRDALTVIVPRHPQRFDEVAALLQKRGLTFVRRSAAQPVPDDCAFMLGDSMGEMSAYYAACNVALIGGSLLPYGAQNLIEACAVGAPVLLGPSTFNFAAAAQLAIAAGAARQIDDVAAALRVAAQLLDDATACRAMRAAGLRFSAVQRGATARTLAMITAHIG